MVEPFETKPLITFSAPQRSRTSIFSVSCSANCAARWTHQEHLHLARVHDLLQVAHQVIVEHVSIVVELVNADDIGLLISKFQPLFGIWTRVEVDDDLLCILNSSPHLSIEWKLRGIIA